MNILGIETATAHGSLALRRNGKLIAQWSLGERFEHSNTLIPQLQRLCKETGLKPADVDAIGVSKGPGSFTGIRVGIACAKGLAMGLNVPVAAVSTLEVLLQGALGDARVPLAQAKRIAVLIDAKKGEFFLQFFLRGARKGAWKAQPAMVLPDERLGDIMLKGKSRAMPQTLIVSPQLSKWSSLLASESFLWDVQDRYPQAAETALLAEQRLKKHKAGDEQIIPMYIRKTDAEILFKDKPRPVFRWERGH